MPSGSHLPIPIEKGETSETLQTLATQFRLNDATMTYIRKRKIENLNDLRFFFADESGDNGDALGSRRSFMPRSKLDAKL